MATQTSPAVVRRRRRGRPVRAAPARRRPGRHGQPRGRRRRRAPPASQNRNVAAPSAAATTATRARVATTASQAARRPGATPAIAPTGVATTAPGGRRGRPGHRRRHTPTPGRTGRHGRPTARGRQDRARGLSQRRRGRWVSGDRGRHGRPPGGWRRDGPTRTGPVAAKPASAGTGDAKRRNGTTRSVIEERPTGGLGSRTGRARSTPTACGQPTCRRSRLSCDPGHAHGPVLGPPGEPLGFDLEGDPPVGSPVGVARQPEAGVIEQVAHEEPGPARAGGTGRRAPARGGAGAGPLRARDAR